MDRWSIYVTFMVVEVVGATLHGFGVYLLYCVHNTTSPQHIFYFNIGLLNILYNITLCVNHLNRALRTSSLTHALPYVGIFFKTTICYTLYSHMAYIVIDRFMIVHLDTKYNFYCNSPNAKHLSLLTWLIGLLLCVSVVVPAEAFPERFRYEDAMHRLIIIYSVVFVCTALTCLGYITYVLSFRKEGGMNTAREQRLVKQKSKMEGDVSVEGNNNIWSSMCVLWNNFRTSRFYISTLLVLVFLAFTAVPDLCMYAYEINKFTEYRFSGEVVLSACYHITMVTVVVVYVVMYEPARSVLKSKMAFKLRRQKKHTLPLLDEEEVTSPTPVDEQCFSRVQFVSTL